LVVSLFAFLVSPFPFNAPTGYCDGLSFSGNRPTPLTVRGQPLHFRGAANLEAVVNDLRAKAGLADATEVLLTGCSAGALAVLLHGDRVSALLRGASGAGVGAAAAGLKMTIKLMPSSGFFLDHPTVEGKQVYRDEMEAAMAMQHVNTSGTSSIFAQDRFPHITSPIFVINSAFDVWQSCCIWVRSPPPFAQPGTLTY
jgi:STAM-binding protein